MTTGKVVFAAPYLIQIDEKNYRTNVKQEHQEEIERLPFVVAKDMWNAGGDYKSAEEVFGNSWTTALLYRLAIAGVMNFGYECKRFYIHDANSREQSVAVAYPVPAEVRDHPA